MNLRVLALSLLCGLTVAGCAGTPSPAPSAGDPYEALNRQIFAFNITLDNAVTLPVAKFYAQQMPETARSGIHNVLTNLNQPVVFTNELLQGHVGAAGEVVGSFALNSTFGIGGLVDVSADAGIPQHDTDFGITLGKWGLGEGPYLMVPLLGPAPPRDLTGKVADFFFDPTNYVSYADQIYVQAGVGTLKILDWRARNIDSLEDIERSSIDYYAATRSLYLQYRKAQVSGDGAKPTDGVQ